ncbi:MAG TPA: amidohydrolase family protein [Longimicrobium sp.]|jgi:hypothetical protein
MIRIAIGVAVLAAFAACAGGRGAASPPGDAVALEGVTVIDGTGAPPRPGMTVLVRRGRIAGIFAAGSQRLPAGTRVVPLAGHYVIPGLIDSHVHLATSDRGGIYPSLLRHTLMGGVTTVRDMGGRTEKVAELARAARTDTALSPRIYYSAVVAGPRWFATYDSVRVRYWSAGHVAGSAPGVRMLSADAEIDGIVREARRIGATGIKVYSDVPPARFAALARAARAQGLRVWTHAVVPPTSPGELVAGGAQVMSHSDQVIWAGAPAVGDRDARRVLLRTVSPQGPAFAALFRAMRQRGVMLEPTLYVMQGRGDGVPARASLDTLPGWAVDAAAAAHRAGVRLLAGTDDMGRQSPNIHGELQLLVRQVGLTPLEAIRSATQYGAEALGAQDSLGTIAPGKVADLVVLRADPSTDIRNTQTIAYVMQRGRLHARTEPWHRMPLSDPPAAP